MGIAFVYQTIRVLVDISSLWSTLPYLSISLSLNILLTLMIVIQLILRARDTRTTLGMTGIGGLCKAIVVMLVESCTLYAVNSVLVIGPLGATNQISGFFLSTIGEIQVRDFLQSRSSDRSPDIATGRTGYRSTIHHSTGRQ